MERFELGRRGAGVEDLALHWRQHHFFPCRRIAAARAERNQDEQVHLSVEVDVVALFGLRRDVGITHDLTCGSRLVGRGLEQIGVWKPGDLLAETPVPSGLQEIGVARAGVEPSALIRGDLDHLGRAVTDPLVVAVSSREVALIGGVLDADRQRPHVGLRGPDAGILLHQEPFVQQLGMKVIVHIEVVAVEEHDVYNVAPLAGLGDPNHLTRVDVERTAHCLHRRLVALGGEGELLNEFPVILFHVYLVVKGAVVFDLKIFYACVIRHNVQFPYK